MQGETFNAKPSRYQREHLYHNNIYNFFGPGV